jgi:membrane protease YdiL (CAAX protease family)
VSERPALPSTASDRTADLALWVLVAAGCVLFVIRPSLTGRAWTPQVLLAGYLTLGLVAALAPIARPMGRSLHPIVVTVAGVAAVLAAAAVVGPSFPLPRSAEVLALNCVAAVAEELFFRRLTFGGLLRFGALTAIVGSAVAFALVHVPIYGPAAIPVDLGAGLVFAWQRWASGGWGAPAATHVFANLLAVLR